MIANRPVSNQQTRFSRKTLHALPAVCASASLVLASAGSESGDKILGVADASLTTYKYASATSVQNVRPLVLARGTGIDGNSRGRGLFGAPVAGNPFGDGTSPAPMFNGINLATGTYSASAVDLAFRGDGGLTWTVGRTYNSRQELSSAHHDSNGPMGYNWAQTLPEVVLYDDDSTPGTEETEDLLYVHSGASWFVEYNRTADSSIRFTGVNGATGVITHDKQAGGEPGTYQLFTRDGRTTYFFDHDGDAGNAQGQIWKIVDADGNSIYVGDETTASTAVSDGYNGDGTIDTVYISATDNGDYRVSYTYTSGKCTQVKGETKTGGTWASPTGLSEVSKVDYTYYGVSESYGSDGDLKKVTITTPMSDSTDSIRNQYFRYWMGAFNDSTNQGYNHGLRLFVDDEGYRQADNADSTFNDSPLTMTDTNLKPFVKLSLEYDSDHRIDKFWANGECGCSGGTNGTHTITYDENGSHPGNAAYDEEWLNRAVVGKPDGTYTTYLSDEVGQSLGTIITDGDPGDSYTDMWATEVVRNSDGQVIQIHTPANNDTYTHDVSSTPTSTFTRKASAGLIRIIERSAAADDLDGLPIARKYKEGNTGTVYYEGYTTLAARSFQSIAGVTLTRPVVTARRRYHTAGASAGTTANYDATTYTYTYYSDTITDPLYTVVKKVVTTNPVVTTANNGSNSATTSSRYTRMDGTMAFGESTDGIFSYTLYTDGRVTKTIRDAQTNHGSDFAAGDDPNTDWGITETSDGERWISTRTYDAQRRPDVATSPSGDTTKMYYTVMSDRRLVTMGPTLYTTGGSTTYYGPTSLRVTNHAGKVEASGKLAFSGGSTTTAPSDWTLENKDDVLEAINTGSLSQLTTSQYNESGGTLLSSRTYYDNPGTPNYLPGTKNTHYNETTFAYDDTGRRIRTKDATETITRQDYDDLGRVTQSSIGTNDNGETGGEASGTNTMIITAKVEYDGNADGGNSYQTKQTIDADGDWGGTTDQGVTESEYDFRGRRIVTKNAQAPHGLAQYDNLGRQTASALYSSTSGLDITDDPTSLTTNRMALNRSFYDQMGRAWKTQTHKIDPADGSDDDNLQTLTWYDGLGRMIKTDGQRLTKTRYDRLGRATNQFMLAITNDTAYAHAADVSGDVVVKETLTVFDEDKKNLVLMTASIDRHNDDYGSTETTGVLDDNDDGVGGTRDDLKITVSDLHGRIQITSFWHDDHGRVTDVVEFGTYGGSDFDRDGMTVPARSDTALRTTTAYNDDGTVLSVSDPMDLEARSLYDDAARRTALISNYVDGTPSGATGDDDVHVRYEYTKGLQTKVWTDQNGDGAEDATEDQVTLYIFGTTKGASAGLSNIATGNLLRAVVYPDSTNAGTSVTDIDSDDSDIVSYAYNASGRQIRIKDRLGNVMEYDYDTALRQTQERATTTAAGVDTAILRKAYGYDNLGELEKVTQYDNATVGAGSVTDEIQYSFDNWGNVSKFEQDHNSTVAAAGTLGFNVDYTYAKATTGRNTIRLSTMDLPDGTTVSYNYTNATSGSGDGDLSRVTSMTMGGTTLADYTNGYLGMVTLVGVDLPEPDVYSKVTGSTSGTYDGLDRFGRVITSSWTWDLSSDQTYHEEDITYDRNGNVTLVDDKIHSGFDASYTNDNLNRLTDAEEGTWNGSTITSRTRQETWTLDQLGNWDIFQRDRNGDGDQADTDELNDDRTHNIFNELTGRDTDDNGTDNYTLTYNANGNLIDDGVHKYIYDYKNRLVKVTDQADTTVTIYGYNGQGRRISWKYDTDTDSDVDANDKTYYFAYNDRWQLMATYRETDSSPKEQFVYHNAGLGGSGQSSYIDSVVLRDKDDSTAWTAAADGLDQRHYYGQNWHEDVSVVFTDTGNMVEWVKYSSYGLPYGMPLGDTNGDGLLTSTDVIQILNWYNASQYSKLGDVDCDGDLDAADVTAVSNASPLTLGWKAPSNEGHRKGLGGYEWDSALATIYHVRRRILHPEVGRFIQQDPLSFVDGQNLFQYVTSRPQVVLDATGLRGVDIETVRHTLKKFSTGDDCAGEWNSFTYLLPRGKGSFMSECGRFSRYAYFVQRQSNADISMTDCQTSENKSGFQQTFFELFTFDNLSLPRLPVSDIPPHPNFGGRFGVRDDYITKFPTGLSDVTINLNGLSYYWCENDRRMLDLDPKDHPSQWKDIPKHSTGGLPSWRGGSTPPPFWPSRASCSYNGGGCHSLTLWGSSCSGSCPYDPLMEGDNIAVWRSDVYPAQMGVPDGVDPVEKRACWVCDLG